MVDALCASVHSLKTHPRGTFFFLSSARPPSSTRSPPMAWMGGESPDGLAHRGRHPHLVGSAGPCLHLATSPLSRPPSSGSLINMQFGPTLLFLEGENPWL
ncbi:hypothetical protein E2562_021741 [Oryza meyeriana var. granulata]|uniref:Uncharacterized protein n=1 Tax=Oryza meyeriana var. granulata TaxID=110450 RepID=A0A6G1E062_9ORYZ|nr:hypothetical protein E2562_021741 [Oryza meyeriana var. granulata]